MSIHVFRLGLTGGIGSGKSTVAGMLAQHGAGVIDADALSRACTASGGAAIDPIRSQFGSGFIDDQGALDRARMRQHVFQSPEARTRLEAIVHPLVAQAIASQVDHLERAGHACLVFDIPLLVESGRWRAQLQHVLVIDCSEETQICRVGVRSGLPATEARRILSTQADRLQRLRAADSVICNDRISLRALAEQVQQISGQFGL